MTDEPRFGKTRFATIRRDFGNLRTAIRAHDSFATEAAWEKCERWMEALPTKAQAAHIAAQDAKIAELEAEAVKTRGYRVGHIAGFHAGTRAAASWHRDVAQHDGQGMEYSSLVGIPISNWDELDTSVKTHEWCEKAILALIPETSDD